jgi:hypothetical protein
MKAKIVTVEILIITVGILIALYTIILSFEYTVRIQNMLHSSIIRDTQYDQNYVSKTNIINQFLIIKNKNHEY